jgi:hypothetical protein
MGVSLTGARGRSVTRLGTMLTTLGIVGSAAFYLYGPAVTPALNGAASAACNDMTGGNYRSYRLRWVVGTHPHWLCGDGRAPDKPPVDLGWWVTPSL